MAPTTRSSTGDFSVGTFLWGDIARIDLPTGIVEMPINSFFCELAAGSSELVPDLLNEKGFTIARNGDGTFEIRGTLVGTSYLQRNFTFRGALEAIDRSEEQRPRTTLTGDLQLDGAAHFTQMQSGERKLSFGYAGINVFRVILAEAGVDLADRYPIRARDACRQLDLMVDLSASEADGVPAGGTSCCATLPPVRRPSTARIWFLSARVRVSGALHPAGRLLVPLP